MAKCAAHFELNSAQLDDKFAQTPSPMAGIPDQPPSLVKDINSAMSWMRNRVVSGSSMAAMVETAEEPQANEDAFQGLFDDDPQSCLHPSPARHEGHGALRGTQSTRTRSGPHSPSSSIRTPSALPAQAESTHQDIGLWSYGTYKRQLPRRSPVNHTDSSLHASDLGLDYFHGIFDDLDPPSERFDRSDFRLHMPPSPTDPAQALRSAASARGPQVGSGSPWDGSGRPWGGPGGPAGPGRVSSLTGE